MTRFFACFALFLSLSPFALAQIQTPTTALQLQELCLSHYDVEAGFCAGYVDAIAELVMLEDNALRGVCLSPAVSSQTLVDTLLRVWAVTPPQPQEEAAVAVKAMLRHSYACPR